MTPGVWTLTLERKPKTLLQDGLEDALVPDPIASRAVLIATNEKEDLVVFKSERLNLESPQKLGPLDVGTDPFLSPPGPAGTRLPGAWATPAAPSSPSPRRAADGKQRAEA